MDVYDLGYMIPVAVFAAFELHAVFTRNKQTASHKFIRWLRAHPKWRVPISVLCGLFFAWLWWHWFSEPGY